MNIMVQVCGLVILTTLLIFYLFQKRLTLHSDKMFFKMLIVMYFVHIWDILSLFVLNHTEQLSTILVNSICKLYLSAIILAVVYTNLYIGQDILPSKKQRTREKRLHGTLVILYYLALILLPIQKHLEAGNAYTSGSAVYLTYGIVFGYIITILIRVTIHRQNMNPDRRIAILIWMGLWLVSGVIQFCYPSLLLVSFFGSIGMMILYIKLEDPGMNVNKSSGLFNQNALLEYMKQHFDDEKSFALIYIAIENFSQDMYGREYIWKNIHEILPTSTAYLFRKSENEIALVFENESKAKAWEKQYAENLAKNNDIGTISLRRSLWISIYHSEFFSGVDELLDYLKYVAILEAARMDIHKDTHIIADEATLYDVRREKQLENILDKALESNSIEVFYQPIFSTAQKRFTSAEALVRLRDENGKIISPIEFIPIAEKNGKIIELGRMVLDKVCHLLKESDITAKGIEYIEVNLSAVQCSTKTLAQTCISILEEHEISPYAINLEITESASLKHKDVFLKNLETLRDYGLRFSLDDFGTGQSNLNYIVDIPVDIVKFDRSMIYSYFKNPRARYVMEAAIQMMHGMDFKIVAEGIETKEQYQKMVELGIEYIQGYYFSRPLPEHEFCEFLSQNLPA